jgi:hypothetical protein
MNAKLAPTVSPEWARLRVRAADLRDHAASDEDRREALAIIAVLDACEAHLGTRVGDALLRLANRMTTKLNQATTDGPTIPPLRR